MAVRKSVRERLEEHKTGKASTSKTTTGSNTGSTLTTERNSTRESVSDRLAKHKAEKTVGFDTFDSDLASVSETISKIYGGWQDADTMKNTKDSVAKMYERLSAANTYVGNNSLGELVSSYKSILDNWDSVAGTYSQFQNADAYSSAKKNYELSEKYKGLDYAGVQKAKLNSEDADWLSEYGVNVGYSSLNDYNTELEDLARRLASSQGDEKKSLQEYYDKLEQKKNQYEIDNKFEKYSDLMNNEDFEKMSAASDADYSIWDMFTAKSDELDYMYLNDEDARKKINIASRLLGGNSGPFSAMSEQAKDGLNSMTEEEKAVYNYIYNTQGAEAARAYKEDMAVTWSKRESDAAEQQMSEFANKNAFNASVASALSVPLSIIGGTTGFIENSLGKLTGKEINPYNYAAQVQNASTAARETVGGNIVKNTDWEIGGVNIAQFAYDTGLSVAESALGAATFGKGFTAIMGMSSASQKAKELKDAGATEEQIVAGSVAAGLAEAAFEKFSIDNLLKPKSAETLRGVLRETAKQMGIEALEEMFTEIANTVSDTLIRQNTSDLAQSFEAYLAKGYTEEEAKKLVGKVVASNVMWAGIGGALSGGVMGSVSSVAGFNATSDWGSTIRNNNNISDLRDITSGLGNDAYAKYLQLIDSGKIKNGQLGGLYGKVAEEVDTNYKKEYANAQVREIANRANELGDSRNSGIIATAIQKKLNNQKLSSEERTALQSDTAKTILQEYKKGEIVVDSTGSLKDAYDTKARMQSLLTTPKSEDKVRVEKRVAEMLTGEETVDIETGKKVEIEGMSKDEEGNTLLHTSEGVRLLSEVTLSDHVAEIVAIAEGMDATKADTFVSLYSEDMDVEEYKASFELAFSYGQNGFGSENVLKNKGVLTAEQAASVYETGIHFATEARQKQIDELTEKHFSGVTPGKFDDSAVDYSKINTTQKAAIDFTRMLSKATGVNVEFFQSEADESGHREAENGRFDRSTNTIYLDVYAGVTEDIAKDSIIPTLSHETTHWMKDKAPEAYKKLSGVVMDVLSKEYGVTPTDLVHAEMKRYKDAYGKEVSEEYAQDELIARASEDMLSGNRSVQEIISHMDEKTAKTFSERLKVAFEKIKEWLADLLSNYKSNSEEAKIVRKYADKVNELQEAWDEAFDKAIKANQVIETSEEVEREAASEREKYSKRKKGYSAYPLSRKYAKIDIGDTVTNEEWEVAGHAIFEEATRRERNGETLAYDGAVASSNHIFYFTHFSDSSIAPQVYRIKSIDARITGGVADVINERKANSESVTGQGTDRTDGSGSASRYRDGETAGQNDSLSANSGRNNKGYGNGRSEGTLNGKMNYSDRDSEGNSLTKEQIEYFKNSKVRDENGNLKVMYHGTENASFTEFNPEYSDDGISMFFTDSKTVAKGYSGTMEEYIVGKKYTAKELTKIINDSYYHVAEEDGKYHIMRNNYGDYVKEHTTDTLEEMQEYVLEEYGSIGAGNYKVYLNIENPLIVEGDNNYWDELPEIDGGGNTTRDYAAYAKANGYDGVIFNNIIDTAIYASSKERFEPATVAIAFDANQIKSVANENPSGDADIRYSDRDSNGNGLTKEQVEYFKDSKVRDEEGNLKLMYHGTADDFTVFEPLLKGGKNGTAEGYGIYFADTKLVSDAYGGKVMSGYLNITRPATSYEKTIKKSELVKLIKTTCEAEAKRFVDDGDYDNLEDALRDTWISDYVYTYDIPISEAYKQVAENILSTNSSDMDIVQEVMHGNGIRDYKSAYKFYDVLKATLGIDGFITEWENKNVNVYSKIAVAFDSNQFKNIDNLNPTSDPDIRYSERNTESIYDAVGELKRLQKENEKLKKDVERLRQRNRLERSVTGGTVLNENQISSVAAYILRNADSTYSREQLTEELKDIYKYLQSDDVTWDILMLKATDTAQRIVAGKKERTIPNDYAKEILYTLRNTKVSMNETQKAEAKYAYGKDWYKMYFGRVLVTNDGIPLDSMWQEWAQMYPDVFDADMSDADMATEVLNAYDAVKASSEIVEAYDRTEMEREIAVEIYNQFWNVSPVRTLADKYEKEIANLKHEKNKALYEKKLAAAQKYDQAIKQLKYEHRVEMKDMRTEYNQRKTEAVFKTKERYQKTISELKTKRAEEIRAIKEKSKEYNQAYRDRLARKAEIDKITNKALKLNTWLVKNSKEAHIPEILKKPVAAVLKSLNFSSERLLGLRGGEYAGTPTQKDISLSKAFEDLANMVESISAAQVNDKDITEMYGYVDLPADFVDFVRSASTNINDLLRTVGDNEYILNKMTLDELKDVDKIISTLSHSVTQMNKALAASHSNSIANMAQETMKYAESVGKHSKHVGKISNFFNFDNALPYYAFKMFGEGGQRIFEAFQDGWDKFAFNVKQIMDYSNKTYSAKEVKEWSKEVHEFDVLNGKENVHVKMTTAQIMSLYCLQKREQAKGHLIGGGIRVADFAEGNGTVSQPDGVTLQEKDIGRITTALTDRQLEVADRLQEFMNTVCTDWGNDVSIVRFGYRAFGEENYFPITSDSNNLLQDDAKEKQNSLFRLLNMSFTKGTIKNANNRVVIDNIFDVFANHTSDMAKYNALALPVLDAFKWYNYKEKIKVNPSDKEDKRFITKGVKQDIENAYGSGAKSYIVQFLRDINGAESGGITTGEQFAKKMMSNYKTAAVGANLRVAILQPTAYVRASVVIDPKYLSMAIFKKPQIEKAKATTGIALWKSMGFYDTNISKGVAEQIKHDDSVMDKIKEGSMKLAEIGDSMTWGYLYNACEAEVSDKHPDLTGKAKEEAVAKRLREVIYATQVVDSTMTRTQMMRNRSTLNQMLTSFMSEPMISYNLLHDCYIQYNADKRRTGSKSVALQKNGKKITRAMLAYTLTTFASALAGSIPDTLREDDEEEDFATLFAQNAIDNAISDATGMIPLVKDAFSAMQGYSATRMDQQYLASTISAYKKIVKSIESGEIDYKTVYSAMKAVSQITGIPFSNLMRDAVAIWNNTVGENYDSIKLK